MSIRPRRDDERPRARVPLHIDAAGRHRGERVFVAAAVAYVEAPVAALEADAEKRHADREVLRLVFVDRAEVLAVTEPIDRGALVMCVA
jgi:hypothetical protein